MAKSRKYQRSRRKSARKSGKRIRKSARKTNTRKRKQRGGEGVEDALIEAAERGDAAEVERLLLANPAIDVNQADRYGGTALYVAAANGHTAVAELLLAHPAIDPHKADDDGMTPLQVAERGGHAAIVNAINNYALNKVSETAIRNSETAYKDDTPLSATNKVLGNKDLAGVIGSYLGDNVNKTATKGARK